MRNITICLTYFKSLTLANLDAALHSVRQQDLSQVKELIVVDNDTQDDEVSILDVVESFGFPIPKRVLSFKHGDAGKTHAWSTNRAVQEVTTDLLFFTRADYLLRFDALEKMLEAKGALPAFATGDGCHLHQDIARCEETAWRDAGPQIFHGTNYDYTLIDTGVWLAPKQAVDAIGGLDESLSAWGHAQTDFQHRLYCAGTPFVKAAETLFWHPLHAAPRDIDLAHAQLAQKGSNLQAMWSRYTGVSPY